MRGTSRSAYLAAGLLLGLGVALFWPHESAQATNSDRDSQFAMITVPVGMVGGGFQDNIDGIFVLDFLTGQLKGAVLNRQTGIFTSFYFRDLASDFGVDPKNEPHYAISSGYAPLAGRDGITFSSGVIYIGELTSGKIAAYAFPYKELQRPSPPIRLTPIDYFPWRQPVKKGA
jgi:hypothetical protein